MLILAGVSINAVVGDNGVLSQAQNAKVATERSKILESLNMELTKYNIGSFINDTTGAREMITDLIDNDFIDGVLASNGDYVQDANSGIGVPLFDDSNNYTGKIQYPVQKDNNAIVIFAGTDGTYQAEFGEVTMSSGGTVSSGTVMVTQDKFNNTAADANDKGKFEITGDASVMFVDEVSGELSIAVKSGAHAKVNIFKNMTLTNAGLRRSAIDIENGGTLDIYIAEGVTVTVDSGFGEDAEMAIPGKGGYAGIHVPGTATLNLYGKGTIMTTGGNASAGSPNPTQDCGGAGGGGAGAGIGGNGGNGGAGKSGVGISGEKGENCGNVNIYNTLKVYAYGGAGGSGATGNFRYSSAGGGGGYPAAGIGGGGAGAAGGTCCAGAGGYSGGAGNSDERQTGINGLSGSGGVSDSNVNNNNNYCGGGGYFEGATGIDLNGLNRKILTFGGFGNQGWNGGRGDISGNGGTAGNGGTIKVSNLSEIFAYNGNLYTNNTSYESGKNQCPIYAQFGISVAKYEYTTTGNISFTMRLTSEQSTIPTISYVNKQYINDSTKRYITKNSILTNVDMSTQGIGSGAGYTELSNGTYTVDNSMN